MVKHVIFDFDGTIADSEELCFTLLNQIAAKHQYRQLERSDLRRLKLMPYPERLELLGVPLSQVPFLAMEARRQYRLGVASLRPFAEIREALQRLQDMGLELHVLSSNSVQSIRKFLAAHELDFFRTINCERNFFGKHIGLRRFLRAHHLDISEVLYLADEVRDVEACRKIDLPIISAGWGFDPIESLEAANPDNTAESPLEAVDLVEQSVAGVEPASALAS
jgi:phosphoglycolate phosphatase